MIHFPKIRLNLVLPFHFRCSRYILIKILYVGYISLPLTPSLGTRPNCLRLPRCYYYTALIITLQMTKAVRLCYSKLLIFFILQSQKYFHVRSDFELCFMFFPVSEMPSCTPSHIFIFRCLDFWGVEVIVALFGPSNLFQCLKVFIQNVS